MELMINRGQTDLGCPSASLNTKPRVSQMPLQSGQGPLRRMKAVQELRMCSEAGNMT